MGKRGGRKGGRGRGGAGGGRPPRDDRVDKQTLPRTNDKFEQYYDELQVVPEEERTQFWDAMRRDLPNSFRFTGSKSHALAVQERLRNYYIPEITTIKFEGEYVDAPKPVPWYPDQLAWYMTTPKQVVRRFKPFASFQKFLVAETDVGNISRQEVVSMIPPLVIDIRPGMTVLDLCAAPGSKSAQLVEMIHSGEEERSREVAESLSNGSSRPDGEAYADDGRSTGLLVANDIDYKRAHMLVHQMKRLASPNLIVTNHDATVFPSIKLSSEGTANGKPGPNRYLKFDRILADVPCSGDGTPRKNLEIWKKWTPSNGLGLHQTQVRILVRALQMLKVGGRVVYSTCSMNPVEDEAVLASAINRCGGPELIEIVESKDLLPGLQRSPGMRQWKIMDKSGRIWNDWASVQKQREDHGDDGLSRLCEEMFSPSNELPLDRAMRVYPHHHDTGAFFIAILEKKSEIRVKQEDKSAAIPKASSAARVNVQDSTGTTVQLETASDGVIIAEDNASSRPATTAVSEADGGHKRKRSENDESADVDTKRTRSELGSGDEARPEVQSVSNGNGVLQEHPQPEIPINGAEQTQATPETTSAGKKNRNQPFEEPFKYLDADIPELEQIREFYKLSPQFPCDRFMVRNAQSTASKNIYYTTQLCKEILQENEGKGMKFVHSGVKMFVKQDAPSAEVCPWRIQSEGMRILETWVGQERVVRLNKKETLRKLLIEMFPRFHGEEWKNLGEIGEQVLGLRMGCCVLVVEPTEAEGGFSERMVFPLWKSVHSLNLMLPKEERKALLLRLFNDDSALVNLGQQSQQKRKKHANPVISNNDDQANKVELNIEESMEDVSIEQSADIDSSRRRNSSSPEMGDEDSNVTRVQGVLNASKPEAEVDDSVAYNGGT